MKIRPVKPCLTTVLATLAALAGAWAGSDENIYVRGLGGSARPIYATDGIYLALPARTLPTDGVDIIKWSGDGKNILMIRSQAARQLTTLEDALNSLMFTSRPEEDLGKEIDIYDVEKGLTRRVWSSDTTNLSITAHVIGKHSEFLLLFSQTNEKNVAHVIFKVNGQDQIEEVPVEHSSAMLLNGETGRWQFIPRFENRMGRMDALTSPLEPKAVITVNVPKTMEAKNGTGESDTGPVSALINNNGTLLKQWPFEMAYPQWLADGKTLTWVGEPSKPGRRWSFYELDANDQVIERSKRNPVYHEPTPNPPIEPLEVSYKPADTYHKSHVSGMYLHPRGLKSSKDLLIAPGGRDASISSGGDAVTFHVGHDLKLVRILKVPPEALDRVKALLKSRALSFAKQAGLAALMFANDSDDVYPGNTDQMYPYIKSEDILNEFNYSMSAINAAQVQSPAETVLGYVNGPGGQAVVYSDGHAKWINDPEP